MNERRTVGIKNESVNEFFLKPYTYMREFEGLNVSNHAVANNNYFGNKKKTKNQQNI